MGEVYTYNATHLTNVREGSVEFVQSAELGAVGQGRFGIDDTAGTQAIVGHKDFSHTESSCSFPLTFRGFVADRTYARDAGHDRSPDLAASRGIGVSVTDLNASAGFRLIDADDGDRPAETISARMTWLLASSYVSGLFFGTTRVSASTTIGMDKADYRNQFPGDVLTDMVQAALGYNWHINDWGSGAELTFRDDNASTADSSTLRISNVLSDASAVTLNPGMDATLRRSPSRVYSKLALAYAKGTVVEERTATATAFNGERGGVASNSNIKTESMAQQEAQYLLHVHSTEEDLIDVPLKAVTSAQVNLIRAGMRIEAKFSHFSQEGYSSFTWFRVLERRVRPIVADGALYDMDLQLSPQESAAPTTGLIQFAVNRVGEGGGLLELANPVTIGNHLVYLVVDRGTFPPPAPNIDAALPRFGSTAWTLFADARTHATEVNGVAAYWKVADTVEQVGYSLSANANIAVYEIAGYNPGGATVAEVNDGVGSPYTLGSLGAVATTAIAFMAIGVGNQPDSGEWAWGGPGAAPSGGYAWNVDYPNPGAAAGWTVDLSRWAYDLTSSGYFIPVQPWGTLAHAIGTGAVIAATIVPGETNHGFGGVTVVIPT